MENKEVEILLVEDNLNDAELTMRALRKNRATTSLVHVKDGSEAIAFVFGTGDFNTRNIHNKPRIILLDLKMPKVDGIEVLTMLKADERTRKIPVVILTSSKENSDIERCYALGANSYVVKPVEFEVFIKAVTQVSLYWIQLNQSPN